MTEMQEYDVLAAARKAERVAVSAPNEQRRAQVCSGQGPINGLQRATEGAVPL
jgi:hypothetical protein